MSPGVAMAYGKTTDHGAKWHPTRRFNDLIGGPIATPERFEYLCPYCRHVNVRYERCGRIVCSKCGRGFG